MKTQGVLSQFSRDLCQKQQQNERTFEETKARMKSLDTISEKAYRNQDIQS